MKKIFILLQSFLSLLSFSQTTDINLAAIALERGHFENAWENASSALKNSKDLDSKLLLKAYTIRGKAGTRLAYDALTNGDVSNTEKYAGIALQAYRDFKEILNTKDSALIKEITPEFYKLGHALLLSGTDYDALNTDKEKPDTSLVNKSIECYSSTIELWELAGKQKYKPYYYRGDAYLAKKEFDKAIMDLEKAMSLYIATSHKLPDLGIGDLGYRLAYTQAGVFNKKAEAMKTIEKTLELLDAEMKLADAKKEFLADQYEDIKSQYDYLLGELDRLKISVSK